MGPDRSPQLRAEPTGRRGSAGGRASSPTKRSKRPRPAEDEGEDGPRWWEGLGRRRTGSTRREVGGGWAKGGENGGQAGGVPHKQRRRSGQIDESSHMGSAESYQSVHGEIPPYAAEEYEAPPQMDPTYPVAPEGYGVHYPVTYPPPGYGVPPRAMAMPPYVAGAMPGQRPLMPPQALYAMEAPPHAMYQAAPKMPPRPLDARGQPLPVPGYAPAPAFPRRGGPPPIVTVDESAKFINVAQSSALNVMAAVGLPFLQNELMVAEARRATPEEVEVYAILTAHLEEMRRNPPETCIDLTMAEQAVASSLLSVCERV